MTVSSFQLLKGDALQQLRRVPDESVHAVVTDPPYGLARETDIELLLEKWLARRQFVNEADGYGGASWDNSVPGPELWREVSRVLMPGGFVLAFAAARTVHLTGLSLHLADFEVRDLVHWVYSPGRPTSPDLGKHDEAMAGLRETLRPSHEPIVVARKPRVSDYTAAEHVGEFRTGALDHAGLLGREGIATNFMAVHDIHCSPGECLCGLGGEGGVPHASHIYPTPDLMRSLDFSKPGKGERPVGADGQGHETVKPVALMRALIAGVSRPGQVVLDPFLGSGTTAEAALQMERHAIGCEMTPAYWDLIDQRITRTKEAGFSVRLGAPFDLRSTSVTPGDEPGPSPESERTAANHQPNNPLERNDPMMLDHCPRCGYPEGDNPPVASLTDDRTPVCSRCHDEEALESEFGTLTIQQMWAAARAGAR